MVIHRCLVTQLRMKTLRIVIHRHIFPDIGNDFLPGPVQPVTGPFPLQAAEEPLHRSIIPAVTFPTHTANHPMLLQQGLGGMTGILATTIRMMNQPRWWFPEIDCHHQGFLHAPIHSPAHHATGIQINHYRQVDPALLGPQIRVSRPGNCSPTAHAEPDVNLSAHPAPIIEPPG